MKRSLHIGKNWPLHLLLLPLFFIFHQWIRFAGLLDAGASFLAFVKIFAAILLFFFCCKLLWKNTGKAAVLTAMLGIVYLFFGDIKYTLGRLPVLHYISHYKIFIPVLLLVLAFIFYKIYRSKQLTNTTLFLNCLLMIYIIIDIIKWTSPPGINTGMVKTDIRSVPKGSKLPNIYYLLLDCYPSPSYQREMLGMMSSDYLDSSLTNKGFHIIKESRSNYSNTAFSMASTFGLNYLANLDTINRMAAHHYNRAVSIVEHSPFFELLDEQGYAIHNFSIFDIGDQPALKKDIFLSATTSQMLFYNTALNCLKRDLLWQLQPNKKNVAEEERIKELKKFFDPQKEYNLRLLDTLSAFQSSTNAAPFFLYAHLEMPHFPYFFDSTGKENPDEAIYTDSMITDKKKFAGYISYANKKAEQLIMHFLQQSGGDAVIIVQSDHCIADMDWNRKNDAFRNYAAYYFPDKDYAPLYSGMSNVNTFRVILNKYFGQQLPLLPDKSFYTR